MLSFTFKEIERTRRVCDLPPPYDAAARLSAISTGLRGLGHARISWSVPPQFQLHGPSETERHAYPHTHTRMGRRERTGTQGAVLPASERTRPWAAERPCSPLLLLVLLWLRRRPPPHTRSTARTWARSPSRPPLAPLHRARVAPVPTLAARLSAHQPAAAQQVQPPVRRAGQRAPRQPALQAGTRVRALGPQKMATAVAAMGGPR
jgi:hypothetical protein